MQAALNRAVSGLKAGENIPSTEKVVGSGGLGSSGSVLQPSPGSQKDVGGGMGLSFRERPRLAKTRHLSHEDGNSSVADLYKKPKVGPRGFFYERKGGQNLIQDRTIRLHGNETFLDSQVAAVTASLAKQRLDEVVEDIDSEDRHIVWLCSEYIEDIMAYHFALERRYQIDPNFLDGGRVTTRMRAVLMDWLVQVHFQYNFVPETLYLCNKIMDRFLCVDREISKGNFQLVGVTSLLLACKYEEVYVPPIREFVKLSDQAFSPEDIRKMEWRILDKLKFDLSSPQPCFFLRRFSRAAKADIKLHSLAKYIMELSVVDFSVVDILPSLLAASSLALALMILRKMTLVEVWNKTLQHYSTYSIPAVRPLALRMSAVLARAQDESQSRLKSIRDKYAKGKKNCRISRLLELNLENWRDRVLKELEEGPVREWTQSLSNISEVFSA